MTDFQWDGAAPDFVLVDGTRQVFALRTGSASPGLVWSDAKGEWDCEFLVPCAIAGVGRHDGSAFSSAGLVEIVRVRDRVEATYVPSGWNGLRVRAAWSPLAGRPGIDLEVQIQAATAEIAPGVEVIVRTEGGARPKAGSEPPAPPTWSGWIAPRDRRAAILSYDGRETAESLEHLTTLPVRPRRRRGLRPDANSLVPEVFPGLRYVEMVAPDDCARRSQCLDLSNLAHPNRFQTRYGLFGHDLEKGVVVRARLRGLWLPPFPSSDEGPMWSAYEEFLNEPPPLGP